MSEPKSAHEYFELYTAGVIQAFRSLLESKHLYQSVFCPSPPAAPTVTMTDLRTMGQVQLTVEHVRSTAEGAWRVMGPNTIERLSRHADDVSLRITPPDVKVFCGNCDRIEPLNLALAHGFGDDDAIGRRVGIVQVLLLSYRCQRFGCIARAKH